MKNILKIMLTACAMLAPFHAGAETIAITGGTAFTMMSAPGESGKIENATILITDGRITQIGTGLTVPENTRTIDATGQIITPGLMNSYTNLTLEEISASAGPTDSYARGSAYGPAFDIRYGINPASVLVATNRIEGLTHAMVAPEASHSIFAGTGGIIHLGEASDILIKPSAALFVTLDEKGSRIAGGARSAAWLDFRTGIEDARHFNKNRKAYEKGKTRVYSLSRADLEALVPAATGQQPVVITARRASDIRQAIAMAREFDLKIIIHGADQAWMMADELAAANIPVILNPETNLPYGFEQLGATFKAAARLEAAGVMVAFSGAGMQLGHNAYLVTQLAGIAVAHGMTWDGALRALTISPAKIWGIDKDYGSLETGKKADIVIWDGDPLDVTTNVAGLIIEGRILPLESRRTRLRDRYLTLEPENNMPFAYQ